MKIGDIIKINSTNLIKCGYNASQGNIDIVGEVGKIFKKIGTNHHYTMALLNNGIYTEVQLKDKDVYKC